MLQTEIPVTFLNNLPVPLLIVSSESEDVNHKVTFANKRFTEVFGWGIEEIPDKNHWWQLAYPDASYRQVVERQWELAVESAIEQGVNSVTMEVNIMTRLNGEQRFKVTGQLSPIFEEHLYPVIFEPCG